MSSTYAIVENGLVVNIVVWDGNSQWSPELGNALPCHSPVSIGWSYDGNEFIQPPFVDPYPDFSSPSTLSSLDSN